MVQRRSESLVKRWSGVKVNNTAFAPRSSLWSLYGADLSGCRRLCTSRVAAVDAGESVEEDSNVEFAEAASSEVQENEEIDSGADNETDEEMDAAGNNAVFVMYH